MRRLKGIDSLTRRDLIIGIRTAIANIDQYENIHVSTQTEMEVESALSDLHLQNLHLAVIAANELFIDG